MNFLSEALAALKTEMEDTARRAPIVAAGAAARASHVAAAGALPGKVADLTAHVASHTATRLDGTISVLDDNGLPRLVHIAGYPEMTLDQLLIETRVVHPEWFTEATVAPAISEASAAISLSARIRASTAAHVAAQAVIKATPTTVNPFDPKTHNLSAQMVLLNTNPALADRMKAALLPAGKHF